MYVPTVIVLAALLVAPAAILLAGGAGAVFTYRLLKGQSPLPPLLPPRPARVTTPEQREADPNRKIQLPRVRT